MPLRIATRASRLARWQADRVAALLAERGAGDVEMVLVSTVGDRRLDVPIGAIGGTGVFVKEVQQALLDGRADIAVHSAKDLPSETAPGLLLAAVPERADPRDALVGGILSELPPGARIGTGSARRKAQLAGARPDLTFGELRGNLETRVAKAAEFDAVVVALAALQRLDMADAAADILDPAVMLPQIAQGALAIECRDGDDATTKLLADLDEPTARRQVEAERAYLRCLGGGCDLACGALAEVRPDGTITIEVLLAAPDGSQVIRLRHEGADPVTTGTEAGQKLLDEAGGRVLLERSGH